jgi:hypothetical protein
VASGQWLERQVPRLRRGESAAPALGITIPSLTMQVPRLVRHGGLAQDDKLAEQELAEGAPGGAGASATADALRMTI